MKSYKINQKLSYRLVAQLFSIAVITETYARHVRNLGPMNRLILRNCEQTSCTYTKMHATAASALTRDPTVV